jgi:hypothetical protein
MLQRVTQLLLLLHVRLGATAEDSSVPAIA